MFNHSLKEYYLSSSINSTSLQLYFQSRSAFDFENKNLQYFFFLFNLNIRPILSRNHNVYAINLMHALCFTGNGKCCVFTKFDGDIGFAKLRNLPPPCIALNKKIMRICQRFGSCPMRLVCKNLAKVMLCKFTGKLFYGYAVGIWLFAGLLVYWRNGVCDFCE